MSHTLFSQAPALRTAARRVASQPFRTSAYHSASGPKMPSGAAPIRTLLRQTTLRATAIAARTSFPATHQFTTTTTSQQPYYTHQRSRSPSPPPPYSTRNTSLLASPNSWTRFHSSSSNTLSAVRTFSSASKPTVRFASTSSAVGSSLSPERAELVEEAIEQITELYGIAKDEFELAHEETEKNTTYAADDRAAARAELDTLIEYYEDVVSGGANAGGDKEVGEEVRRRVGGRIRELVKAVEAMEEAVTHGD